jgi:RES domain-containing protein
VRGFRIGDPAGKFPIYSRKGAALAEGRWHEKGQEVIYTSEHYSTAMLEKLAHFNGLLPPNQHFIDITVPVGTSYEVATKDTVPGWDAADGSPARAFGSRWISEHRSATLIVPSYVAREERNVLINPRHPDATAIKAGLEHPIWWDPRLLARWQLSTRLSAPVSD